MPFADYDSFEDCVSDNQDKDSPEGFCAWLHYQTTGEWPSTKNITKKGDDGMPLKIRGIEESYEQLREKLRLHFEKDYKEPFIIYTFSDAVILKDYSNEKTYEIEYAIIDGKIKSGEPKEVETAYILKRLLDEAKTNITEKGMNEALKVYLYYNNTKKWPGEKTDGTELTGPIFKKVEKQRLVYAAVLVPGEPDLDAEIGEKILTAEEIEGVAHKWMEEYGNIDYMHGLNNVAKPVETFILPMEWEVEAFGEKMTLPKGTWVLAAKVVNDTAWKKVENGELTGFSIMGIQNNVLKTIMNDVSKGERVDKAINGAMKRVLIRDLGKDWIVPFVSLVDEPCVPKAKFFAIKAKDKKELPEVDPNLINKNYSEESIWNKIMKHFKKDDLEHIIDNITKLTKEAKKAGRSISDDTFEKLKSALAALQALIEKADKERKPDYMKNKKQKGDELEMEEKDVIKLIDDRLDEKLKPIDEGLKALLPKEEVEKGEEEKENKEEKVEKSDKKKTAEKKENSEETEETEEGEDTEKDALKAENISLKETLEKLQKIKKGLSKAVNGQEDGEDSKTYSTKDHLKELGRDSMGRAIKGKE